MEKYEPFYDVGGLKPCEFDGIKIKCSSCGKLRLAAIDIPHDGNIFRVCVSCLKGSTDNKVRKCLKCEAEFISIHDFRLCSRCRGKRWNDRIDAKLDKNKAYYAKKFTDEQTTNN